MPRYQQSLDEETAAARQHLLEQLRQLSRAFQRWGQARPLG